MSVSHARKYVITSGPVLGHISPVTGARTFVPMCFHLIVYIPLRRLSPSSICIVARGFYANSCVSVMPDRYLLSPPAQLDISDVRDCVRWEKWCSRLSIASVFIISLWLSWSPAVYNLTSIASLIACYRKDVSAARMLSVTECLSTSEKSLGNVL
jgi:hypothetical protein